MLADQVDAVVGGDTHRDTHSLEMLASTGAVIARVVIDNDAAGFAAAVEWITGCAPGPRVVIGVEGTRSYGVGLYRALRAAGFTVVEVERPRRRDRRRGKSDAIDAHLAAVQVLGLDAARVAVPRRDGDREALRILLSARNELTVSRTRQVNRLHALLLTGDDTDRELGRGRFSAARLGRIARRRGPLDGVEQRVRCAEARRLARAIQAAGRDLRANEKQLTAIVRALAPAVLDRPGVGPVSGAQLIVSFSHRGRCRDDAAFAALAGACPIPASSGRTVRHRLNRGGDRHLNRALHTIALVRWRSCPRTRAYIETRRAHSKSDREIRRCLKRFIAREMFRILNASPALAG